MFKITITRRVPEKTTLGRRWDKKADGSSGYEYTPIVDTVETVERTIYEQTVDVLDMNGVIRAVNGI